MSPAPLNVEMATEGEVKAAVEAAMEVAMKTVETPRSRGRPKSNVKKEKDVRCELSLQQYNKMGKYISFYCKYTISEF